MKQMTRIFQMFDLHGLIAQQRPLHAGGQDFVQIVVGKQLMFIVRLRQGKR